MVARRLKEAPVHPVTAEVTERIVERSREARADYLDRMEAARRAGPGRAKLNCANFAHAFAAAPDDDKARLRNPAAPNIGIVSSYNDMLSAHQPLERFPEIIKAAAREVAPRRNTPAGCRPCAMVSPSSSPAWSCRCSPATLSPCRPPSP